MMMASHHQEAIWDIAIRASLADLGIADRGGAEGTRTPDPHTASVVRYQLRHSPEVAAPP